MVMLISHLNCFSNALNKFLRKYENVIILGDFHAEVIRNRISEFVPMYNLKDLIKEKT